MEESGIMGWLHSKGEVITVFIYIESELKLPLKESFCAFLLSYTNLSLSLAKCTRSNHLYNANSFHRGIYAAVFYLLMGFNIICSQAKTLFCATLKAGSESKTVSADWDK